ncbi:hypothetical protein FZC78_07705 [Rossellomorea vietnamensis]|uniref:ParB/Sulfiredoxin domain-containing protein n=1 Tax=Rossellomorea vietnamensis TaxID=218284 RepID=A0A5D4NWP3_9BACI|nr:hypothetical protein [Rossellomorea vietnamensis]TYS17736.1 hypothetical protein FZC78_07705 [Rossellomorea vietnamensis]
MKLMKLSPAFKPCQPVEGEEVFANGVIRWNISKMQEYIDAHPEEIEFKQMEMKLLTNEYTNIDLDHVPTVDLSTPIILVEFNPKIQDHLIDGRHRVTRARELGVTTLPAYKLTRDQHILFLASQTGYEAYVRYWNEKARNWYEDERKR